jgi:hypothetical protein
MPIRPALAPLLLALALAALPARAADPADGDGGLDLAELRSVWPGLTDDDFAVIDANGDGRVDALELEAARAAGLLP